MLNKTAEVRLNKLLVNLASLPVAAAVFTGTIILWNNLPHANGPDDLDLIWFLISIPVVAVIHEGLHAWAMLHWGDISKDDVKFGFKWKSLMPYFHSKAPLKIQAYRIMALFPLIILGPLSLLLLLLIPTFWICLITGFVISSCFSDVLIVTRLVRFSNHLLVQDHPSEVGCEIFSIG